MPSLVVRPARISDAGQILEFITELAIYEKAEHAVKSRITDIEVTLFGEKSTAHALIGEKDSVANGMAVYFFNYSTWLGKNGLYLEDLYVTKNHRGSGMGKKLLSHLARIAVEQNCGRMEWSVLDWNQPAIDVYDSLGAKPQNEWIGYRLTGESLINLSNNV